jgi:polynucleotide 5'-kinase involved in rRNA processing
MDPLVQPDPEAGLYVESDPREEIVDEIARTVELKPDRRLLVVGCTGSGKTTLMRRCVQRVREAVKETGDYGAYLDVSRFHRFDAEPLEGVLIAIAGKHVAPSAPT